MTPNGTISDIPYKRDALYLIIVSCMFSTMYLVNKDYQFNSKVR